MDIIVLIAFGILLLGAVLIFRKPHQQQIDLFIENSHGVQPLLKEKSAQIKYHTLHEHLQSHADALTQLEKLKEDYDDKHIDIQEYEDSLDILMKEHVNP